MKQHIHPKYNSILASCACGNIIEIKSTLSKNINLDVCDMCHPFYTGTQRIIDTKGRVNLFNKRFNMNSSNNFISVV